MQAKEVWDFMRGKRGIVIPAFPVHPMIPCFYLPPFTQIPEEFKRALLCLRAHLSPRQLAEFDNVRAFTCRGNLTGVSYRIEPAISNNVRILPSGYPICVVSDISLHIPDHMLLQKLYIETDERYFLRVSRMARFFGLLP